ncbi:hypothetical protein [Bradyrhizobium sp. ORS 285]|uniref:hypothetical protein n=1 Tax=Bradyrhizobium sp. ORS 285 TaxID=115808 RepID=UPI000240572D|nr:hypothetical protein [Bradyrhizobium sp. ORS 285]CCD89426.1 exported hypothetical protein [Bradyrhizobium sp. ORS 285]
MKVFPLVVIACAVSQAAFAEGLECRRVADPTPRLSCVETPTTAQAPAPSRTDAWTPEPRRETPARDGNQAAGGSRIR